MDDWRQVEGWPEYLVSDGGDIKSVGSNWRGYGDRLLSQTLNASGYPSVRLTRDGSRTRIAVHKIVATAFHGQCPASADQVRHLDGNKFNNAASNLAWGTALENAQDRDLHGTTDRMPWSAEKREKIMAGHQAKALAKARGEA